MGRVEAGVEDGDTQRFIERWLCQAKDADRSKMTASAVAHAGDGMAKPAPQSARQKNGSERARHTHHIYGTTSALTVAVETLRVWDDSPDPKFTVVIEGAKAIGPQRYDWEHKIQFQVMLRELPLLACALLGTLYGPLKFENHGPAADKSLEIMDQGKRLFVRLSQARNLIAVPVTPADVFEWASLVMVALTRNAKPLDGGQITRMLDRVAAMANVKKERETA